MRNLLSVVFSLASFLAFAPSAEGAEIACTDGEVIDDTGGSTVEYPCLRVNLLSHMTISELGGTSENDSASDIWGWVDTDPDSDPNTTGTKHYAIVGLYCSTAFVDISDPENPVLVATLPDSTEFATQECSGSTSSPKPSGLQKHDEEKKEGAVWRDIKVQNNRAYIVSDHFDTSTGSGPGLQVLDLTRLRGLDGSPVKEFTQGEQIKLGNFNAHNVFTYSSNGHSYAVAVGASSGSVSGNAVCNGQSNHGGPLFFNIDALQPVYISRYCGDGYTHDIECVEYAGPDTQHTGDEICIASNEDTLTILDVSNKTDVQLLARGFYEFTEYAHQGSLEAGHRYFYFDDELDERQRGIPTRTLVWDLTDLEMPKVVTEYLATTPSIDHNQYVHGDYLYQSNYTAGLRVLDIHARKSPYQKAYFDLHPQDDSVNFSGNWSNYRFPDGVVVASSISGGLFVLHPTFESVTDEADVDVSITTDVESRIPVGTPFQVSVTLNNAGPDDSGEVFATLHLSRGGQYVSGSVSAPECEITNTRLMECSLDNLGTGQSVTYEVEVEGVADAGVTMIGMASPLAIDAKGANNVADENVSFAATRPPSSGGGTSGLLWMSVLFLLYFGKRRQA